jgi:hypothetical protein
MQHLTLVSVISTSLSMHYFDGVFSLLSQIISITAGVVALFIAYSTYKKTNIERKLAQNKLCTRCKGKLNLCDDTLTCKFK